jgi:hypothetical protein
MRGNQREATTAAMLTPREFLMVETLAGLPVLTLLSVS